MSATRETTDKARRVVLGLLGEGAVPTEEDLDKAIDIACAALDAMGDEPVDRKQLRRRIEADISIFVGDSEALDGDEDAHEPWLEQLGPNVEWRFWRAYREWMLNRLSTDVVRGLDRVTDDILGRLENPRRPGRWDRRGMVVGQVQSGKTGNYTGLICKAADAGYPFIVILAGVHNSLRSQTQRRLDEGFLGLDSRTSAAFANTNRQIGVGAGGRRHPAALSLTSSEERGDFSRQIASRVAGRIGSTPVILVIKKNKTILDNLIDWIGQTNGVIDPNTGRRVVREFPILVIDDEADYASVNTKDIEFEVDEEGTVVAESDPATINRLIRSLLHIFERSALVSYTATPFANIFIDEEQRSPKYGEDLFPRSFILRLPPPSNYMGPAEVFGVAAADDQPGTRKTGLPVLRTMEDTSTWLRPGHRKDAVPGRPPASLREAMRAFILVCAIRRARGAADSHNSMLVHVTRFVDVQRHVSDQVQAELDRLDDALRYGTGDVRATERELCELFETDFLPTCEALPVELRGVPVSWEEVSRELPAAVARIRVLQINGTAGDALEYADHPDGISVIAIGGDKLSRGLTLEGLTVSYYLRASRMYDTLMQMGRWFGYRDGYTDLVRLYTTGELQSWYRDITVANEELHRKFGEMAATHSNPRDFALYVRKSPVGLLVTAHAKMRSGRTMQLAFADEVMETINVACKPEVQQRNTTMVEDFLAGVIAEHGRPSPDPSKGGNYLWRGVEGPDVAKLLQSFATYEGASKVNGRLMASYVRERVAAGHLTGWTVVLVNNTQGRVAPLAGLDVGVSIRNGTVIDGVLGINRLGDPSHEYIDLDKAEHDEALNITVARYRAGESKAKTKPVNPAGWAARQVRPPTRGLIVLYLLDPAPAALDVTPGLVGFLVSFPADPDAPTMDYVMPRRYWESMAA